MPLFSSCMLACEIQNDKIGLCQSKLVFTAFGLCEKVTSAPYTVLCFVGSQLAVSYSREWGLPAWEQTNIFLFWNYLSQAEIIESQNSLCWKGPLKVLQSNCHRSERGHLQLDQVAQSPVQPGLEYFQGWGIYHLSRQPSW